MHTAKATWTVDFHGDFVAEYHALPRDVQNELLACVRLVEHFGPLLGRPRVDTLNGLRHASMKELMFDAVRGRQIRRQWKAILRATRRKGGLEF